MSQFSGNIVQESRAINLLFFGIVKRQLYHYLKDNLGIRGLYRMSSNLTNLIRFLVMLGDKIAYLDFKGLFLLSLTLYGIPLFSFVLMF